MARENLVVFISSPGDVRPERAAAERIVQRLARQFATQFKISSVRWERHPLRATADFQSQIPRASRADIVVLILWSRVGTVLDEARYRGPVSGEPVTGTEYEFEDALSGHDGVQPALFVYRKTGIPQFTDERQILDYPEQSAKVTRFFEKWIARVAHHTFSDMVTFEELLTDHLAGEIRTRIDAPGADASASWFQGSPFKGLEAFDTADGPIFFGRSRAQTELARLVVGRATQGQPWGIVLGPSGSGKSSLVRAGLLPALATPGFIEGVGSCRYAVMRPGESAGDLVSGLCTTLMGPHALPELQDLQYTPATLTPLLRAAPAFATTLLEQGLAAARKADGVLEHAHVRLALVIDQLEELFSLQISEAAIAQFVEIMDALAATGAVWIVATLRTDFLQDLERSALLAARFDSEGRYLLAAPNEAELAQIIDGPVQAAGLRFATDDMSGVLLGDALRMAARSSPAALPLLEYVLEQLWQRRTDSGVLTWQAYRELGELEGAIGARAEEVFLQLPEAAQQALSKVLRALATAAPGDAGVPTARPAPLNLFPLGSPSRALVDAFASGNARLLVTQGDPGPQVRVAHEALLRNWPRAEALLHADLKDLQLRYRLDQQADLWSPSRDPSRLLSPGLPLTEAQDLVGRRRDELREETLEFISVSATAYEDELEQERRRRIEADWRRAQAELAQRLAASEEYFARALETARRTGKLTSGTSWKERSAALEAEAKRLLSSAYELHRQLRDHPGASTQPPAAGQMFSLENLGAESECLLVHFGPAAAPRLILIDGTRQTFRSPLLPRLETLRERRANGGTLSIDLVMVSHYDADHVAGAFELLRYLQGDGAGSFKIENLWYNNFQAIYPPSETKATSFKEELRKLADALSIPVNVPFESFVMPAAAGPTRLTLPGDLEITIVGPPFQSVKSWYRAWLSNQRQKGTLSKAFSSLEEEAASGVELRLIRTPPVAFDPSFPRQADLSVANQSSIIAHLQFQGRTMLLTGDARADHIERGLFEAWLLDPDAGIDVDVFKLPHFGSMRNCSVDLFRRVRAGHYVVPKSRIFHLPRPELFNAIAEARGPAQYAVHADSPLVVDLLEPLVD